MRLSKLKQASDYEVQEWLEEKLNLTSDQKRMLNDYEIVRFAPFEFYKPRETKKIPIFWRLTIILYAIYLLIIIVFLPINMLITGHWGYGTKLQNFHSIWSNKLNF